MAVKTKKNQSESKSCLSNRISLMAASETLAMSMRSNELQSAGIDVINLSVGEPDFATPEAIKLAGIAGITKDYSHYPPVPGYFDLRQAIVKKLARDNDLEYKITQIVVSNGAKHSLMNVFLSLLNQGDEVIIPAPYWVSYPEMVKICGAIPVSIKAGIEQHFKVTAKQIKAAITPKTKMLIMNSPSNPTGMVYSHAELKSIADLLEKYPDIYILSDEIYEYINFSGSHESLASFSAIRDRVVLVNGVSKGYAMTGWRIGYMAAPLEIAEACTKIQGQMTSAACSIAQRAAIAAMKEDPKTSKSLIEMIQTFNDRRNLMLEGLSKVPEFELTVPDGAFYLFINVKKMFGKMYKKKKLRSGADVANFLLNEAHVALVGGDAFGDTECIRISYAAKSERLSEAIERISEAIAQLR